MFHYFLLFRRIGTGTKKLPYIPGSSNYLVKEGKLRCRQIDFQVPIGRRGSVVCSNAPFGLWDFVKTESFHLHSLYSSFQTRIAEYHPSFVLYINFFHEPLT